MVVVARAKKPCPIKQEELGKSHFAGAKTGDTRTRKRKRKRVS